MQKSLPTASHQHPAGLAPIVRIAPSAGWATLRLRELWEYRELLYFLVWRDVKVRYKQTALGAAWAIIQPLLTMAVFALFFGRLAGIPSDGIAYPLFAYVGLLPWQYFAQSLGQSSNSLVGSANLLRKVYFPRLIAPIASVAVGIVDFAAACTVLLGLMAYYRVAPTAALLALPLFLLLALITALGAGLWLSALHVQYRDVRYIVPFLTQFWMFATPVVYPSSLLDEPWRTLYGLNPMAGVVEGFRWSLLGARPPGALIAVSACVALLLLASGALYFRRMERVFADIV